MNRLPLLAVALALAPSSFGETIFGVTDDQTLVTWNSATPGALTSGRAITGLQPNERLLGIDFRPATGQLYAVGSSSRLYTVNTGTGALSLVGSGPFSPAVNGSRFGFDFNPVIDRIRFVSDVNANFVLNPNTGAATQTTDVFFPAGDVNAGADPNVIHSAYTNNVKGATTTQLFGIDSGLDLLVTQANSAGTLGTRGPLRTDVTATGGFDISGATGVAYLAIQDAQLARSTFWTVDLATGAGSPLGAIGGGVLITAISVATVPEPLSAGLVLASCAAALCRVRV